MPRGSHVFESHTAEVKVRLRAPTLAELFVEAGRAVADLMVEPGALGEPGPPRSVELEAADPERLLVDWIDELVYLSEVHHEIYSDFTIRELDGRRLVATVRGGAPAAIKTAVKAATHHDLSVRESDGGFMATVVLDV